MTCLGLLGPQLPALPGTGREFRLKAKFEAPELFSGPPSPPRTIQAQRRRTGYQGHGLGRIWKADLEERALGASIVQCCIVGACRTRLTSPQETGSSVILPECNPGRLPPPSVSNQNGRIGPSCVAPAASPGSWPATSFLWKPLSLSLSLSLSRPRPIVRPPWAALAAKHLLHSRPNHRILRTHPAAGGAVLGCGEAVYRGE